MEAGIAIVEMTKGMSKNRRSLLISLKFLRALPSPELHISRGLLLLTQPVCTMLGVQRKTKEMVGSFVWETTGQS